MPQVTLL